MLKLKYGGFAQPDDGSMRGGDRCAAADSRVCILRTKHICSELYHKLHIFVRDPTLFLNQAFFPLALCYPYTDGFFGENRGFDWC